MHALLADHILKCEKRGELLCQECHRNAEEPNESRPKQSPERNRVRNRILRDLPMIRPMVQCSRKIGTVARAMPEQWREQHPSRQ